MYDYNTFFSQISKKRIKYRYNIFTREREQKMLVTKPYKRENAAEYARKFAFSQNVYFGNFAEIGDVIQLGRNTDGFYHTLLVVGFEGDDPLIAAQTNDAYMRPLSTYSYDFARYIKILGVRYTTDDDYACYNKIINAPSTPNPPVGEGQ